MTMRATVTYTRTRPCNISPGLSCTESVTTHEDEDQPSAYAALQNMVHCRYNDSVKQSYPKSKA